ncbi:MAG TPA: VCBS repeat-containing protein, partial [Thermoanaerobaculia bacterium]
MHSPCSSPHGPFRAFVLSVALLLAVAGAATAATTATTAPPSPTPTPSPAPAKPVPPAVAAAAAKSAAAPAPGPAALEPPDGKWLTDEKGRQYFVTPAPRQEGLYRWENPEHTRVRLPYGLTMDVVSYDDKNFYVKIYKPEDAPAPPASRQTPENLAKVAASYKFDTPDAHRVSFQPFDDGLPRRGQWRNGFVVADMNGDGHPDIVHGVPRKGGIKPVIFLGDGKGHWTQWATTFPKVAFDYGDVAVGDLNGDGKMDLVVASHLRGITAMLGDGKGNFKLWSQGIEFQEPGTGETKPPFSSRAIMLYDWNHDGKLDILAAGEGPRLALTRTTPSDDSFNQGARGFRVYLNQGTGSWITKGDKGVELFGDAVTAGDFNGDGIADFAMGSGVMGNRNILGYGQADGSWKWASLDGLRPSSVTALVAADFNHDGRLDLAVGYTAVELGVWRTGIDIFFARADGTW